MRHYTTETDRSNRRPMALDDLPDVETALLLLHFIKTLRRCGRRFYFLPDTPTAGAVRDLERTGIITVKDVDGVCFRADFVGVTR